MIVFYVVRNICGTRVIVKFNPDMVDPEVRVGPPAESFKRRIVCVIKPRILYPMTVWKSRSPIANLHSILPHPQLPVVGGHRVVQLDHHFNTHPFIPSKILCRGTAIDHVISVATAVVISPASHITPVKVGVHRRLFDRFVSDRNPAVTQSARARPWVWPGSRRIVAPKPYPFMMDIS